MQFKFVRELLTLCGFIYYIVELMDAAEVISVYYFKIHDAYLAGEAVSATQLEQLYFINNELWCIAGVLVAITLYLMLNYVVYVRFLIVDARSMQLEDVLG